MIDIQTETVIPISEARQHVPGRPSKQTVDRWASTGARGVKLESILVGGRRFTSLEAIQRFAERATAAADGDMQTRTPRQRQRAIAAAERELSRVGI